MNPLNLLRHVKSEALRRWRLRNYVPGLTSAGEQAFARTFVQQDYRGAGEIVDLGSLLGATTIPIAIGLERNRHVPRKEKRIHAYDLFKWYSGMEDLPGGFSRSYQPGDSFLAEFEARIARYGKYIKTYPGDILEIGWHGAPIEFLFADATKSWELCDYVYREFFPYLLPKQGVLCEQDFKHHYTPWIHLLHFRLRSNFSLISALPGNCSVVFRVERSIDPALATMKDLKSASDEEVDDAFRYSLSLVGEGKNWEQGNVLAAKVMFYIHQERWAEAHACFRRVLDEGYTLQSDLGICQRLLESRGDG